VDKWIGEGRKDQIKGSHVRRNREEIENAKLLYFRLFKGYNFSKNL